MDGVLADFFAEYAKLAGVTNGSYRDIPPAKVDPTLDKMIGTDFFARLPMFPTAPQLVAMTVKQFGKYHICSSPLRGDFANSEKWKRVWIQKHLKPQPTDIIITPNKAKYAVQKDGTPNILIDDRGSNISSWEAAGGIGIKYQADEDSLQKVVDGFKRAMNITSGEEEHKPQELKSLDRGKMIQVAKSGDSDDEVKEDQTDYEIRNYEKLDTFLAKLCKMVVEGKKRDPERYGMVAACVLDNDNRAVFGINLPAGDGKRVHAERVAMEAYEKKYGEIPEGSIVITTCSPCSETMDEREGESCTDYINNSNVKKVYCGFHDPTQDEEQREFNMMETQNKAIRDLCEKFASTFLDYEEQQADENFADGKHPGRKGLSKRMGVNTKASVSSLRKTAKHSTGEKARMAHWLANMKAGREK
jgi:pyrimidine deaminase RibD-like protein